MQPMAASTFQANTMNIDKEKLVPKARYRITHPDPLNWCIEEWQEGGGTISRGRFAGQEMAAKWKASNSFHSSLKNACLALLDKAAGDAVVTGEAASILDAIKIAEARVLETLGEHLAKVPKVAE